MKRSWLLPNGDLTQDQNKFHKEWDVYLDFLREKGFTIISYCPDITVINKNNTDKSVRFHIWALDKLMD